LLDGRSMLASEPRLLTVSFHPATFLRSADLYTYPLEVFRIKVQVNYGNIDLFGLAARCTGFKCRGGDKNGEACGGLNDVSTCVGGGSCLYDTCTPCRPCNATSPPLNYLTFSYRRNSLGTLVPGQHTLEAEGSYTAILALLVNLRYKALANQNSLRLRSPSLNPSTFSVQPYETATYVILQRQLSGVFAQAGNITVMIRIAGVNDPPVVVNPRDLYVPPPSCETVGVDLRKVPLECFFGPYWVREDTSDVLQIAGFSVSDVDLTEGDTAAALDTKILVHKGIVDLNTRTNLKFYDQNARSRRGFTAAQVAPEPSASLSRCARLRSIDFLGPEQV
jgi:hypothetical protein